MTCELWTNKLDAYVDGETPAEDLPAFEEHLRVCHHCAAEALTRMQTKRATRPAAALRFSPSPELRRRIEQTIASRRTRPAFWMRPAFVIALAAVLLLAVAVPSAIFVQRTTREQELSQLLDMHVAALASANPVDVVSSDRHTVKPWFQGKLPFTFNLPELANSPYTLKGGRLVYFHSQPGAQLIYELRKHELSVFIVQDGSSTGFVSVQQKNGFSTESWTAAGLRYVVMSDAGAADVHALGEMLRGAQR